MVVLFVVGFSSPTIASDGSSLRDINYEFILSMVEEEAEARGFDYDPNMIVESSVGAVTLEEAITEVLNVADLYNINIEAIYGSQFIAGQGDFPINGMGGIALFLELGIGGGGLPSSLRCSETIHETVVTTNTLNKAAPAFLFSKDGTVSSDASEHGNVIGIALGTDILGVTFDATVYDTTIFAGPNFDGGCVTIQICIWGFCILWIYLDLYLVNGEITDDMGTGLKGTLRSVI